MNLISIFIYYYLFGRNKDNEKLSFSLKQATLNNQETQNSRFEMGHLISKHDNKEVFDGIFYCPKGAVNIAVKKVFFRDRKSKRRFNAEINNLKFFQNKKNFVQIIGAEVGATEGIILTEMGKGNVRDYIEANELPLEKKIQIVRDVVNAIVFMHKNNYVHRNLKWENVLYFDNDLNIIKLSGFSYSQDKDKVNNRVGTPFMMAPEVEYLGCGSFCSGKAADIYSLGKMINQIFGVYCSIGCIQDHRLTMFKSLTNTDPNLRPTAEHVLEILEFFKRLNLNN